MRSPMLGVSAYSDGEVGVALEFCSVSDDRRSNDNQQVRGRACRQSGVYWRRDTIRYEMLF